jgi:hypothetical protein
MHTYTHIWSLQCISSAHFVIHPSIPWIDQIVDIANVKGTAVLECPKKRNTNQCSKRWWVLHSCEKLYIYMITSMHIGCELFHIHTTHIWSLQCISSAYFVIHTYIPSYIHDHFSAYRVLTLSYIHTYIHTCIYHHFNAYWLRTFSAELSSTRRFFSCIYACMYVCMYVCVCVYVCMFFSRAQF